MSKDLLNIENLYVNAGNKEILKGINLNIKKGEIHVIMGPNGSGKSTTANAIFNNPQYNRINGKIKLDGQDISNLKTDEIARLGVFMSFQLPEEIPGITVTNFLKYAKNKVTGKPVKIFEFKEELKRCMEELKMNPKLVILDETDSGLDVDAIRTVSKGIKMFKNNENGVLIITHNNKILKSLKVDYVHVLVDGKIVKTGDQELATTIENEGYEKYR